MLLLNVYTLAIFVTHFQMTQPCDTGCSNCIFFWFCASCYTGYYHYSINCGRCSGYCYSCVDSAHTCTGCYSQHNRQLSSTTCVCKPGYYDYGSVSCGQCNYKCTTCVSTSTNCQSCGGNRLSAPTCACAPGYYDNGYSANCPACHRSCSTCSNGYSCNSCNASMKRVFPTSGNLCSCMDGYYDDGTNQLCKSCHLTCVTCNGGATNNCRTCSVSAHRQLSSGSCVCMTGYYQVSSSIQNCATCHTSCKTCNGPATNNCLSCDSALHRTLSSSTCVCSNGYFQDASGLCRACHSSCATCTSLDACSTCITSQNTTLNSTSGVCGCASGGYFDNSANQCKACHYSCSTCSTTSMNCTGCVSTRRFTGNSCPCITGYHDDGSSAQCSNCHYSCKTCNVNGCLSCTSSKHRELSGVACKCKAGFYDDGSNQMCSICDHTCLTCTNGTACASCDTGNFLQLNQTSNLCNCMEKHYENDGGDCASCHYSCQSCYNSISCHTCESATNHRQLQAETQLCSCEDGYFDDGSNQLCQPCHYTCATCTESSKCTTCHGSYFRSYAQSSQSCPCIEKYYDNSVQLCVACSYTCKTCSSGSECLTCNTTAHRVKNSDNNQCECDIGYYDDNSNEQCESCHYSCVTCTSASACVTCSSGAHRAIGSNNYCECVDRFYQLDDQNVICDSCHYSCLTCTDQFSCTSCDASNFRIPDDLGLLCQCMDRYYDDGQDNQLCLSCPYQCQTCTNSTACLTCNETNFRQTPEDKCPCMEGYYDDGSDAQLCVVCPYYCHTCSSGSSCLTCNDVMMRQLNSDNQQCDCVDGYYDIGLASEQELCQICSYTCLTCSITEDNCTSCEEGNERTLVNNACVCNQFFYDDEINVECLPCHYSCATCSDTTTCDSCDAALHRELDPTTGQCKCSQSYYDDGTDQMECKRCEATCLECEDDTACTDCDATILRYLNTSANYEDETNEYCSCLYKYYEPVDPNTICLPCHYSCSVCSGPLDTECLFCSEDGKRQLNDTTGKCDCMDGFFDNLTSIQTCQPCHLYCKNCSNYTASTCFACNDEYYYHIPTTTCGVGCPDYYYGNTTDMLCYLCDYHCIICTGPGQCTSCDQGYPLYEGECLDECPAQSTYENTTQNACLECPEFCLTCNSDIYCTSCTPEGYMDEQLNMCFQCNEFCVGCFGPAYNQCQDCEYPLYFSNYQCFNLSCAYGQYVDSHQGCVNCDTLFPNSLTCNISEPLLCEHLYKLRQGRCVYCSDVPGYKLSENTNNCSQICGDGMVIDFQCDDGNNDGGDGCSSNCVIEEGWHCEADSNDLSICQLDGSISMELGRIYKYAGSNKVRFYLQLSMPLRLSAQFFTLEIQGVGSSKFRWQFSQSGSLEQIDFIIEYEQNIDKRKIRISYSANRRRLLSSFALAFDDEFSIESFPPSLYYSEQQIAEFKNIRNIIFILSLTLFILAAVSFIAVKKMAVHIFSFFSVPTLLYVGFGVAAEDYTDWIKWALQPLQQVAMMGGFTLGEKGQTTDFLTHSTYLWENSGLAICIMSALWLLYALLIVAKKFCCGGEGFLKIIMFYRYFILTAQLCLAPHLWFSTISALYSSSLTSQGSSINVCLAIFICIYLLGLLTAIFILSLEISPPGVDEQDKQSSLDQNASSNDQSRIERSSQQGFSDTGSQTTQKQQFQIQSNRSEIDFFPRGSSSRIYPETSSRGEQDSITQLIGSEARYLERQRKYLQQWLIYDYVQLYNKGKWPKFYLPFALSKLYLYILACAVGSTNPFVMYAFLSGLSLIYGICIVVVNPFIYTLTTTRIVITEFGLAILCGFIAYLSFHSYYRGKYSSDFEYYFLLGVLGFLAIEILLLIAQNLSSWRVQIWNKLQPCLKQSRLRGDHKQLQYKPTKTKRQQLKVELDCQTPTETKKPESELEAFFARMIQKKKLDQQFRKQRRIHAREQTFS